MTRPAKYEDQHWEHYYKHVWELHFFKYLPIMFVWSCYVVYNCCFCNKGLDLVPRHLCGQFITRTIHMSISSNVIYVLCFICYLYGYVYPMLSMCLFHTTKFHACQFFLTWSNFILMRRFNHIVQFYPCCLLSTIIVDLICITKFIHMVLFHPHGDYSSSVYIQFHPNGWV
jgi:uncharacterized membrane protein